MSVETVTEQLLNDELARARIRAWLEEEIGAKKTSSVWDILNSPLCVWLLSSVILSLAVFIFGLTTDHFKAEAQRTSQIDHLKVELRYRLDPSVLKVLYAGDGGPETLLNPTAVLYLCNSPGAHLQGISESTPQVQVALPDIAVDARVKQLLQDRFVFLEFKERSVFSLLWELQDIDQADQTKVRAASDAIDQMREASLTGTPVDTGVLTQPITDLTASWT